MRRFYFIMIILLAGSFCPASLTAGERVRHALKVSLYPAEQGLTAEDRITVPENLLPEFRFRLHEGLNPTLLTRGATLVREGKERASVPVESYRITLPLGIKTFTLQYGGQISHPPESEGKEYARGFRKFPWGAVLAEFRWLLYPPSSQRPVCLGPFGFLPEKTRNEEGWERKDLIGPPIILH